MSPAQKYYKEVCHEQLGKRRVISGTDQFLVDFKADALYDEWERQWQRIEERQELLEERAEKQETASIRTSEAEARIREVEGLLKAALKVDSKIDWDTLYDSADFQVPRPELSPIEPPVKDTLPPSPQSDDTQYCPRLSIIDRVFPARAKRKLEEAQANYRKALETWEEQKEKAERAYENNLTLYKEAQLAAESKLGEDIASWEKDRDAFWAKQKRKNEAIDKRKAQYFSTNPEAISDYCELVLSRSRYPKGFPQDFEVDYIPNTKMVVVDYWLPPPEKMPVLKGVKYIPSRDEFKESFLSEVEKNRLYDSALYQIALRTLHEIFEADQIDAVDHATFNGWVKFTDTSTGQKRTACIMSLQVMKSEFSSINLQSVDPKACFRALKGVGSAKLFGMSPIAPLLQIPRDDKRFVSSYAVADSLDDSMNIAAMDWEDFEHLVRELFEKEFTSSGGEVKITRASRDGGVDAVAFDPDPIRGGKIVIQAKRYTNAVGVAAVRDLYGTLINEGATKGILITTSDYGPDAFEFAKGKPITLLSGANLLHLLNKHGYHARIDIKEAKQILSDQNKSS